MRSPSVKDKIKALNDPLGAAVSREEYVDLEMFTYLGSDIHVSEDSSYKVSR